MTSFVLATANPHKAEEIRALLDGVVLLPRPEHVPEVVEDGDTLEENALLKARALVSATGHAAIADDTGLFVDALGGRPGVWSARYAGENATYADNVAKMLGELAGVPAAQRTARFRTVAAVAYPDESWFVVDGELEGVITDDARGENGFGYDPIFAPTGLKGRTLAELTAAEKHALSHRGNAFRELAEALAAR
ncbi:MAG: RdgB/HAM1 family non-canonical purine NTP pyrophosphatase [Actinomycetota bacterium]|jgi:XTP/dITP diphosphohydrolase